MKVNLLYDTESGECSYRCLVIEQDTVIGYEYDNQYIHTVYNVYAVDGSFLHMAESMCGAILYIDESVYVS